MLMTIDVPDQIVRAAEVHGITVEQELQRLAKPQTEPDLTGLKPWGVTHESPEIAAEARRRATDSIREIASRNTLGGLNIEDLVNEGRKR